MHSFQNFLTHILRALHLKFTSRDATWLAFVRCGLYEAQWLPIVIDRFADASVTGSYSQNAV